MLYSDIHANTAAIKPGLGEIKSCCIQALWEGVGFVWVDTCCRDKSSSTELSEASTQCFVGIEMLVCVMFT